MVPTYVKTWNIADAAKALETEHEMANCLNTDGQMLMLTFPDPKLNRDIVKSFAPSILNVDFRVPATPRYCFVQLTKIADVKQVRENLSKIHFGLGPIICEHLNMVQKPSMLTKTEDIDPYKLYIENIPLKISGRRIRQQFEGSLNCHIGFKRNSKYLRFACVQYKTIEDSIKAFRNTFNWNTGEQSLVLRFYRTKNRNKVLVPNYDVPPQENNSSELSSMDSFAGSELLLISHIVQEDIKPAFIIESRATTPTPRQSSQSNSNNTTTNTDQLSCIATNQLLTVKTESNYSHGLPVKMESSEEETQTLETTDSAAPNVDENTHFDDLINENSQPSQNSSEFEHHDGNVTSDDEDDGDSNENEIDQILYNNNDNDDDDNNSEHESDSNAKRPKLCTDEQIDIKPKINVPPINLPRKKPFNLKYCYKPKSTGDPELDRLFDGLNPDDGFYL